MKLVLSLLALAFVSTGAVANAADPAEMGLMAAKKQEAKKFAKDLPGTLVVRRDSAGNVAIYHSPKALPKGQRLNYDPRFQEGFATREVPITNGLSAPYGYRGLGGLGGLFNFFWNVADSYSSPTYNYYNPGYNYSYNYGYTPYYNYYDPYGYSYSYYSWF